MKKFLWLWVSVIWDVYWALATGMAMGEKFVWNTDMTSLIIFMGITVWEIQKALSEAGGN